ncbi:TPA: hypothetical protein OUL15_003739 [Clostridioides difficile]|nr:hypothetical protein [Clostridioides difficile]MCC0738423.1 hypothetical protein [Clostridioides sp. ZZV14-5902]AUA29358.1 hypothetical protein CWR54_09935 [Clostridioides difficile]EGT4585064.1 hypothetical protein [Clostridioides difficile]EGT5082480.1 hypothetical protein [Clostridioides difficile]EGT5160158.1 hypothetical protein [Clostridioides difficile]
MIEDKIKVKLNEGKVIYEARLDIGAIAETQYYFKQRNDYMKIMEIIDGVFKDDIMIIKELLLQSILRCHNQLSREDILDNLKLKELINIREYISELILISFPEPDDKKKANN